MVCWRNHLLDGRRQLGNRRVHLIEQSEQVVPTSARPRQQGK